MRRGITFGLLPLLVLGNQGCVGAAIARRVAQRHAAGTETTIAELNCSIWRPQSGGARPLVIFSHGYHGSSTQSTFLTQSLADHGYLVIAPNHRDSSKVTSERPLEGLDQFRDASNWDENSRRDRQADLVKLMGALKRDPAWTRTIDWNKVAVVGHSLGGYTALGVAGGWPSWRIPEVKAVVALSPYCAPYVLRKTIGGIKVPVMFQGGTRDMTVTPAVAQPGGAFDQMTSPAWFVNFEGANHFAWTDRTRAYHESAETYCVAFLDQVLQGQSSTDLAVRRRDVAELRSK